MKMQILTTSQSIEWIKVLENCPRYDFYHLPQYHVLAEDEGNAKAFLFHFREDEYTIAVPLLIRPLNELPGIRIGTTEWRDATSIYGYAGPVTSHNDIPEPVIQNFQASLRSLLENMGVVTVFTRLHPLLPQLATLAGLGECTTLSRTVSIDLSLPPEAQRAGFRSSVKSGLNKLRRSGVTCILDTACLHLDAFIDVYYETMRRVDAPASYFFTRAYFYKLAATLGERFHLFVCLHDGKVVSGGIFIECRGIVQYHLGGTLDSALELAPMKLVMDEVRLWGTDKGFGFLHLGGGATTRANDPLMYFKLGFSKQTHDFSVWRWVLNAGTYESLCADVSSWNEKNQRAVTSKGFFPQYRAPTEPVAEGSLVAAQCAH